MEKAKQIAYDVTDEAGLDMSFDDLFEIACEFIDTTDNTEAFREFIRAHVAHLTGG